MPEVRMGSSQGWGRFSTGCGWIVGVLACLVATLAGTPPAHGFGPRTHTWVADQILQEPKSRNTLTIYAEDYGAGQPRHDASGKLVPLGEFEVNPAFLVALRTNPGSFLAGALGSDTFPDVVTGGMAAKSGASGGALGGGADAWMSSVYSQVMADPAVLSNGLPNAVYGIGTGGGRAFAGGYLTHAASEMYAGAFTKGFLLGDESDPGDEPVSRLREMREAYELVIDGAAPPASAHADLGREAGRFAQTTRVRGEPRPSASTWTWL